MCRRIVRVPLLVIAALSLALAGTSQAQEPIRFGQTIEQQLDSGDSVTQDGSVFDAYDFSTDTAGQSYVITGNSTELPLFLSLYLSEATTQSLVLIQAAYVDEADRQVQFSGVLGTAGSYILFVQSTEPGLLGAYAVSLAEQGQAEAPCAGGTRAQPVQLQLGMRLDCVMTVEDVPFGNAVGETLYGKFFRVESDGGELTVHTESDAITPFVQVYAAPDSTEVVAAEQAEATVSVSPGPVLFAVVNLDAEGTGPFTVVADVAASP